MTPSYTSLLHISYVLLTLQYVRSLRTTMQPTEWYQNFDMAKINQETEEAKHVYQVALAKKAGPPRYDPPLYSNTSDFKELVKNSQYFIDNSLLIEAIIEEFSYQSRYLRICAPPKWGKTVNMKMLQAFFEPEVHPNGSLLEPRTNTPNYNLFRVGNVVLDNGTSQRLCKPLLILNNKHFCHLHQGQYPVMYLPFRNLSGFSVDEVRQNIIKFLQQLFREHEYVLPPMLAHKNKTETDPNIISWVNGKMSRYLEILKGNVTQYERALDFLSQVLFEHFNKKVVVIMDDYTDPTTTAQQNKKLTFDQLEEIDTMVNNLTYSLTHNFFYNRLIIIISSNESHLPTYEHFWDNNIAARDLSWFSHFGFNQKDVHSLFNNRSVPESLLQLPIKSYETPAKDVNMETMANYLNRADVKQVLLDY